MLKDLNKICKIAKMIGVSLVLLTPVLYKELIFSDVPSFSRVLSSFIYCLVPISLIYILRNKILFYVIIILASLISIIESILIVMYGSYINAGNILSAITTTNNECMGFLRLALPSVLYIIPIIGGVIMSCCVRFESQTKDSLKVCWAFLISVFLIICQCVKHQGDITPFFYIEQNLLGRPPYNFWYQTFNALHLLEQKAQIENAKKNEFLCK